MLILIKFNAETFQRVKKIPSLHINLGGAIYGILAVCNGLLLEQTLCNAVTLGD